MIGWIDGVCSPRVFELGVFDLEGSALGRFETRLTIAGVGAAGRKSVGT